MSKVQWPLFDLHDAIRERNILKFRTALAESNKSLVTDDEYLFVFEKTLKTYGCAEFVKACLEFGFAANYIYNNKSALNFAADSEDPEILKVLLGANGNDLNVNFKHDETTPLNTLAKNLGRENITDIKKCIQILLDHGASPNIADQQEMTPLHYVVKNDGLEEVQKEELIKIFVSWPNLDIDTHCKGKLRTILTEKYPDMQLPGIYKRAISYDTLLRYIQNNDGDSFKTDFESNLRNTTEEENQHLLIKSIEFKRHLPFDILMETGIDDNRNFIHNRTLFDISCTYGNCYAIQKLLKNTDLRIIPDYYPFKTIFYYMDESVDLKRNDYWSCFLELLDSNKFDINEVDQSKSTALHYAIKYRCYEAVKKLLERGADITVKNCENKIAIDGMNLEDLKEHFDSCITSGDGDSDDDGDINDDNDNKDKDEICINFKNLRPKKSSSHNKVEEMECIEFMAKSENYRDILTHPVITGYLFLKWHKCSLVFYINFFFYIFYAISVITYSVLKFKQTDYKILMNTFQLFSFIGFHYMFVREILQFFGNPKRYFCTISNYIEILLIVLSLTTILNFGRETERQLVIFLILLAAFELYLQVGSIPVPSISTHMLMLEAVSKTFLKSCLIYSTLIIPFPLCFYILYESAEEEDKFHRFQDFYVAVSKTLVMLTGELEASNLNLKSFCSYVVFLLFVFFMTITLYNLLNGLAISDTQTIKDQAESNFSICRIKSLTAFEQFYLSRTKPDAIIKKLNVEPLRSMWKELFNVYSQDTQCSKIYILPNDDRKILLSKKPLPDVDTKDVEKRDTIVCMNGEDRKLCWRNETNKDDKIRRHNLLPSWISSKKYAQIDKSIVQMAMSVLEGKYKKRIVERAGEPLEMINYKLDHMKAFPLEEMKIKLNKIVRYLELENKSK